MSASEEEAWLMEVAKDAEGAESARASSKWWALTLHVAVGSALGMLIFHCFYLFSSALLGLMLRSCRMCRSAHSILSLYLRHHECVEGAYQRLDEEKGEKEKPKTSGTSSGCSASGGSDSGSGSGAGGQDVDYQESSFVNETVDESQSLVNISTDVRRGTVSVKKSD